MQFLFNEISLLVSEMQVAFQQISRSTNGMTDSLAKQGVDRSCNLSAPIMYLGWVRWLIHFSSTSSPKNCL